MLDSLKDIVVPLAGLVFSAAVVLAAMFYRHRGRELRHQTIRLALEKGQPLPPELLHEPSGASSGRDLRRGVILTSLGIGLSLFLWSRNASSWGAGLIVAALGVGFLVSHWLAPRSVADAGKR